MVHPLCKTVMKYLDFFQIRRRHGCDSNPGLCCIRKNIWKLYNILLYFAIGAYTAFAAEVAGKLRRSTSISRDRSFCADECTDELVGDVLHGGIASPLGKFRLYSMPVAWTYVQTNTCNDGTWLVLILYMSEAMNGNCSCLEKTYYPSTSSPYRRCFRILVLLNQSSTPRL